MKRLLAMSFALAIIAVLYVMAAGEPIYDHQVILDPIAFMEMEGEFRDLNSRKTNKRLVNIPDQFLWPAINEGSRSHWHSRITNYRARRSLKFEAYQRKLNQPGWGWRNVERENELMGKKPFFYLYAFKDIPRGQRK